MARYDHLQLVRLPEQLERRKRRGFGAAPERDRPEHLRRADEADHDLGAVAARLGDTDAAFDDGVGANAVIALVEYAPILGQAAHTRAGRRR